MRDNGSVPSITIGEKTFIDDETEYEDFYEDDAVVYGADFVIMSFAGLSYVFERVGICRNIVQTCFRVYQSALHKRWLKNKAPAFMYLIQSASAGEVLIALKIRKLIE